jgi:hypothetical protein
MQPSRPSPPSRPLREISAIQCRLVPIYNRKNNFSVALSGFNWL